jgi:hypothetical protein
MNQTKSKTVTKSMAQYFENISALPSIGVVLVLKFLLYFSILLYGTPINRSNFHRYDTHWPVKGGPIWASRLACADAADYLALANCWYKPGSRLCAFYPLWPYLLKVTGISKSPIAPIGSVLLAFAFWAAGMRILHLWMERVTNDAIARVVTLTCLALPSSMFFWLGYTESLFFFLVAVFISTSDSNRWLPSVIAAVLIPLTRPVGLFIILIPIFKILLGPSTSWRQSVIQLIGSLVGFVIYLAIISISTGNLWEGFVAQDFYVNRPSLLHLLEPVEFFKCFIQVDGWHTPKGSVIDRITFIYCAALLVPMWRMNPAFCLWSIPMFVIPAFTNWFLSLSRFSIVIIPIIVALGLWIHKCDRWVLWVFVVFGLCNQAFLLNQHFAFEWGS